MSNRDPTLFTKMFRGLFALFIMGASIVIGGYIGAAIVTYIADALGHQGEDLLGKMLLGGLAGVVVGIIVGAKILGRIWNKL